MSWDPEKRKVAFDPENNPLGPLLIGPLLIEQLLIEQLLIEQLLIGPPLTRPLLATEGADRHYTAADQ